MVELNAGKASDPGAPSGGVKRGDDGRKAARRASSEFTLSPHIAVTW
jgi:hypothetical protein